MVYGRYGYYATFHDFKNDHDRELLNIIEQNKYAKVIIFKNYVIFPIEQFGVVHGYVKIENGIMLKESQLKQVNELSDLLIKTIVISEKNKRIQLIIEEIIKNDLKSKSINFEYPDDTLTNKFLINKKFGCLNVLRSNLPILILSSTHLAATKLSFDQHNEYHNEYFITVDESNLSYFRTESSISTFNRATIFIPELAYLEKQSQLAFESYLTKSIKNSKVIGATIFNPIHLIEKQIVRKELINLLSSNRVLNPDDECKLVDKSNLTKFLHNTDADPMRVVALLPEHWS